MCARRPACSAAWGLFLLVLGCSRAPDRGLPAPVPSRVRSDPPPSSQPRLRVANPDARTFDQQPDYDREAHQLRIMVSARVSRELIADPRQACEAMLDQAEAFYTRTEPEPELQPQILGHLRATREKDLERCMEETRPEAATCVKIRLEQRDSEFPWLLDQCERAFPLDPGSERPPLPPPSSGPNGAK